MTFSRKSSEPPSNAAKKIDMILFAKIHLVVIYLSNNITVYICMCVTIKNIFLSKLIP